MLLGHARCAGSLGLFLGLSALVPVGCAGTVPARSRGPGSAPAPIAASSGKRAKASHPAAKAAAAAPLDSPIRPGFFPTVVRDGKTLLVIPKSRLGRDFLLHAELTQGLALRELTPGVGLAAANDLLVAFEQREGQVVLVRRQLELYAAAGEEAKRAVRAATSDAVLASCPIVATLAQGPAVALDKLLLGGVVGAVRGLSIEGRF